MGTVVHRALPFLHEGSLENTRTVPLKSSKWPNADSSLCKSILNITA